VPTTVSFSEPAARICGLIKGIADVSLVGAVLVGAYTIYAIVSKYAGSGITINHLIYDQYSRSRVWVPMCGMYPAPLS
jgi:hypothetical protein